MEKVNITIDGYRIEAPKTATVLEAARLAGIKIPTLCYHPELRPEGACRVCMVEVEGARSLVAACVYPVNEGMVVNTRTEAVRNCRRMMVELLLANHPQDCLICQRNLNCELQAIAAELGVRKVRFAGGEKKNIKLDANNPALVRDQNKCILCGRCIRACSERQGVHAYSFVNRGFNTTVAPAFNSGLGEAACTFCGQCASVCPTGAIVEKDDTAAVWQAIRNPQKRVIVQTAPAVRVALGEALGMGAGSIVTGKMVAALRQLGFDQIFDTVFGADVTIMEEGAELLERLRQGGTMPLITSCCPGWVNFIELMYPELLGHLSTTKSPHQILGSLAKSYYAEQSKIEARDIICVSIMPCTAKKTEIGREDLKYNGYQDVDYVLTTRELARMIREAGIDFRGLAEEPFDIPLGIATGAGVIFGTTGGVMEAALRTVTEIVTGSPLAHIDFFDVRGLSGVREAVIPLGDMNAKVALVHGLSNARLILEKIKAGEADYHFIEVMACHGGCISGAGQPAINCTDTRRKRSEALYKCDQESTVRKSHENPAVRELYDTWLGKPLGEKAHRLLHTQYHPQKRG